MIVSDSEKLDNLKKRRDLKLNTEIEIIMKDRGISKDEAQEVLKNILEERIERSMQQINQIPVEEEDASREDDSQ